MTIKCCKRDYLSTERVLNKKQAIIYTGRMETRTTKKSYNGLMKEIYLTRLNLQSQEVYIISIFQIE